MPRRPDPPEGGTPNRSSGRRFCRAFSNITLAYLATDTRLVFAADDLAAAFTRLIERPDRIAEMGRESRRMVADRFSDARVIDQTIAAYAAAGIAV